MNKVGRFDVCEAAIRAVAGNDTKLDTSAHQMITYFQHQNKLAEQHALDTGADAEWFEGGAQLFEQ